MNGRKYRCVKIRKNDETRYIFFSDKLYKDQMRKKRKKFKKTLEKNSSKLKKLKSGKHLAEYITEEGIIIAKGSLQKILDEVQNPYINGIEGFFTLESSVDTDPRLILVIQGP